MKQRYIVGLIFFVFAFSLLPVLISCIFFGKPFENYIDLVATLFSGLAFIALYYSIHQQNIAIDNQTVSIKLQRNDLKLQREQLDQSIAEQKQANEEYRKQNETLSLQKFENTFYQLLNFQMDLQNRLYLYVDNNEFKGLDVFSYLITTIEKKYLIGLDANGPVVKQTLAYDDQLRIFSNIYNNWSDDKNFRKQVDPFIKFIDLTCKHVNETDFLSTKQKEDYFQIIRSQFTNGLIEYLLLFTYYKTKKSFNTERIVKSLELIDNYNSNENEALSTLMWIISDRYFKYSEE